MKKLYMKLLISIFLVISINIIGQIENVGGRPPASESVIPALNFKDADIRDLLRGIAVQYQTNIFIDNRINYRVSLSLFEVSVFDAVRMIAEDNGLDFSFDKNRFYIKQLEPKAKPTPKMPDPVVYYNKEDDLITLKLTNTDIGNFVNLLRMQTGRNFLINSGVTGQIDGELENINFETGVRNLLQLNGFYLTEKDSIYYVSRSDYFSAIPSSGGNNYWVSAQENNITIHVKNAPLNRVIDDLAIQLELQIVKLAEPNSNVTIKCSNVPLEIALYYLFKGSNYTYKEENNTYVIGEKADKTLDNIKMIKLEHLRADKIIEKIPQSFITGVQLKAILEHNALVVTGSNSALNEIELYIKEIDQPIPQVMIEALVVDFNLDKVFKRGIEAGRGDSTKFYKADQWFPGLDVTMGGGRINKILKDVDKINLFGAEINVGKLGKLPDDFYMNISMMQEDGVANIKSRPLLSTLNGHTASLEIGQVQNYVFKQIMPIQNQINSTYLEQEKIEKIEANISFEITPWVGPNNQLTLEVKPDFKTPVGEFSPDKNKIPAINTRTLQSTVKLRDGETIVVGGLIQDIVASSKKKFPFLGDLPYIGEFFSSTSETKTKAELVIYITPHIFYEDEFGFVRYEYGKDGI